MFFLCTYVGLIYGWPLTAPGSFLGCYVAKGENCKYNRNLIMQEKNFNHNFFSNKKYNSQKI